MKRKMVVFFMITVLTLVSMEVSVLARPLMCAGDVCGTYVGYLIVTDITCNRAGCPETRPDEVCVLECKKYLCDHWFWGTYYSYYQVRYNCDCKDSKYCE